MYRNKIFSISIVKRTGKKPFYGEWVMMTD